MEGRDPDARRPLTDEMTWGETQRMWAGVYAKERDTARQQHGEAVSALHEAIQLARDFNRGAMTWREYDRKLAAIEVANPRQEPNT